MSEFDDKMRAYAAYHRNHKNRLTHFVGIPLVVFSLFIAAAWVYLDIIGFFAIAVYYVRLDRVIGGITVAWFLVLMFIAHQIAALSGSFSLSVFLVTAPLGVFFQLLGHRLEGNRPAFMDNFWHNLTGPLFITYEAREIFRRP